MRAHRPLDADWRCLVLPGVALVRRTRIACVPRSAPWVTLRCRVNRLSWIKGALRAPAGHGQATASPCRSATAGQAGTCGR